MARFCHQYAFAIFCFIGVASTSLYAQEKTTDTIYKLDAMIVTASKTPQSPGNVTQKIDVITNEEIKKDISGNRNISEIIASKPGSSVSVLSRNDANWGTYGGIGPKYSTYMLQGLPLDAFVDPMSLDLNAIDRIEVQRGPASVLYPNYLSQDFAGNQSPLAGTVNLILKEKVDKKMTTLQTAYGSYNTINGQVFHQNRFGRLNYFGGSSYEMSDYTNYGTEGSWLNMRKNPEYKKTKVYGGLTLFMDENEKQKMTLFAQETWHDGDAGRVYRGFDNQYGTVNAGYEISISERLHLQSHMGMRSYDRTWQDSKFGAIGIDTLTANSGVNQIIIPADISLSFRHLDASLLCVGADYQEARYFTWSDPLVGYRTYGNKSSAMQGGIYAQEELRPIEKLTLRGGLRYSYIKNLIEAVDGAAPGDSSVKWSKVLWSAGVRYSITDRIAVFANSGSSFLTPGLKSSGGTIRSSDRGVVGHDGQLPNPDLKPESGIGSDAGVNFKLPANFKVDVRGFYIDVEDAIIDNVVSQNPSQTQSINAGSSNSTGGEIEISQRLTTMFSWFANYTYMSTKITNDKDTSQNGAEIPFSPKNVANLGLSFATSFGLEITPSLNFNDGYYDGSTKSSRKHFYPGVLLNASVSQRLAQGESYTVECFAQLYNITNNDYEMPWQFKNPGFSGMGGIRVVF